MLSSAHTYQEHNSPEKKFDPLIHVQISSINPRQKQELNPPKTHDQENQVSTLDNASPSPEPLQQKNEQLTAPIIPMALSDLSQILASN